MKVTFFGHSDAPLSVAKNLRQILIKLIEIEGADEFYVGNHGVFDRMVAGVLRELKQKYPQISFRIVLAYMPTNNENLDLSNTIYPEGLELVPLRFAIIRRNEWMIKNCDTVITYVTRTAGGAARFSELAHKRNKRIINLAT